MEFGVRDSPPKRLETKLREALNHPVEMARIVSEMEAALEPADLQAVQRHLDSLISGIGRICRLHSGSGRGGTSRILNDAIHRTKARVARAVMAEAFEPPEDAPIARPTIRHWIATYGFLTEDALEEMMRKRRHPLTLADLRRKKLDMDVRAAGDHPNGRAP